MSLVRGPFTVKLGDNFIEDIEEIDFEYDVDSEDFNTVGGKTLELDGAHKVGATLTLLASDIPALAAIMPQYYVPNGEQLSTGETVNNADGAMDFKAAACGEDIVYNNLDIISCGNPSHVLRMVNARTRINGVEVSDKIMKVMVRFIGESQSDEAGLQLFREGTINTVS